MENKLIEWTLDDVMGELKRISLVSVPAIEEEFLLFNNTDLKFKTLDESKRIVTGPAMRPDIHIPRKGDEGELYYGFFSQDTVRKAAELFFKKNSNANNTNLEHEFEIDGVYVFESWIVEDPEMDKAKAVGFNDVRKGDWWVSMKVENENVWNNYLKSGLIRGFSVEVKAGETDIEQTLNKIKFILENNNNVDEAFALISHIFNEEIYIDVYGFKPKHFDMCPGAVSTFNHLVEMNVDDDTKGMIRSAAGIADVVFRIEKEAYQNGASEEDVIEATILVDDMMDLMREIDEITGMEHNIDYMLGHIEKIKSLIK